MANKGMVRYDMQGLCPSVQIRQAGVYKSAKGNIPVETVDLQGWLEEQEGRLCLLKTKNN